MCVLSGLRAPKRNRLGVDYAGVAGAVAEGITVFEPEDPVYGMCDGAFAQCVCAPGTDVALKR